MQKGSKKHSSDLSVSSYDLTGSDKILLFVKKPASVRNKEMDSTAAKSLIREDSLEEFEFVDSEGDLNVDLSKSPIHGVAEKAGAGLHSVISVISSVVEQQGIVVTIPATTLATSAVGAITGTVLGGPPGLAVGLLTGAFLGYYNSPRKASSPATQQGRTSIRHILNQMTLQQKKELLKELLGCLKHSNVRSLILEILKNEGIRNMALDILSGFLMKKMGVTLTRPK